ncbi:MAG: GGDEF domain-containing protein [Alphaproteobacteria bacterium]|nr:GGDEF domain-containing protein [Alphaproteobacteria bacterium]MDE2336398.1 GGDEF domain-containing protein [Alphaproteobacteria bacterium]
MPEKPSESQTLKPAAVAGMPRAQDLGRMAMAKIAALAIEPTPQIYELWFRYFQGDPEIKAAIDAHAGVLDETACYKFYKRFLSETARGDAIRTISDHIQQAISDLAHTIDSVKSMTSDYGGSLNGVSEKIRNAATLEDLGEAVSAIVEDTRMMLEKNQSLEFELTNSSTQVAELKKNLDNVRKEALTDGLTGLSNRKAFDKQIRDWIDDADAGGGKLCLVMIDIDHFKSFNDTYGHQVGDQVLRLVARTLVDGIKGGDFAARFGGEEFAIILPNTPLSGAERVADSLRRAVENKEVVNKSNNKSLGRITFSGGIAEYVQGESIASLIDRADAALYAAKHSGRNRIKSAGP